jgi:photosynthetic reaction center H subunit
MEGSPDSTGPRDTTLYRLNEITGYAVADYSPDIRGWGVRSRDGRLIGRVIDLIFDKSAMKVRYLDMELEKEFMADGDHTDVHLLVPIGAARVEETEDYVVIDRILTNEELHQHPRSRAGVITRDHEHSVVDYYNGAEIYTGEGTRYQPGVSGSKDDPIIAYDRDDEDTFYNQEWFRPENLYRNRRP